MKRAKKVRGVLRKAIDRIKFKLAANGNLLEFDENWIKNKRIALIGSADSAFKEPLGSYIDSFDVVVRINKGVELVEKHSEFIGTRTDILFHCFYEGKAGGGSPVTTELWNKQGLKTLLFSYNESSELYGHLLEQFYLKHKPNGFKVSRITLEHNKDNFSKVAPHYPTTGFIAINTLMNCQPKELYVSGLTFYKTPFQPDYREGDLDFWRNDIHQIGVHNPEIEYQAAKALYLQSPEIFRPDATLKTIFEIY